MLRGWRKVRFWSSNISVWFLLDTMTCGTWYLPKESLVCWLNSDQRSPLLPETRRSHRLYALNLWHILHSCRFLFYLVVFHRYEEVIVNRVVAKPRFPYYFLDVMLLMTTFTFYVYISSTMGNILCFLTTIRFHWKPEKPKKLAWFRVYVYIEEMIKMERWNAKSRLRLLRWVTSRQYLRYRSRFGTTLRLAFAMNQGDLVFCLFSIAEVMRRVIKHPEWDYPILPTLLVAFQNHVWYHIVLKTIICQVIIFCLNSMFVQMLLHSTLDLLGNTKRRIWIIKPVVELFSDSFHTLVDINRFWRSNYAYFCFTMVPCAMVALYVLLFVDCNLIFFIMCSYVMIIIVLTLNLLNLIAAKVRSTGLTIYKQLYHQKVIFRDKETLTNQFKLINIAQILTSTTNRFGVQLGTMGTANQRTAIIMFIVMVRVLIFAIKIARGIHQIK